tara:strand:+ start:1355 stop:2665 length:1311 start_codon:yes stop_codon:yes gene_type:complete
VSTISIIIPVLNEASTLRSNLPLLYRLLAAGHELIIVDGGSSDGSEQVARQFSDKVLISAPGRAQQMNAGATAATGDILLFLHIDTVLPASAAQLIVDGLTVTGRHWGRFDVRLSGSHPAFVLVAAMMNLRSRLTGVATGDQAIFVRRDLFAEAGGFPDIALMEDVALSKRLRSAGKPLCLTACVISSSRRWEKHGILRTIWLMWRLRLAYFFGADPAVLHQRYYAGIPGYRFPDAKLLVFAKAPVRGRVKTRLQSLLSEEAALQLHKKLIAYTWRRLGRQDFLPAQLWASEAGHEGFFLELCSAQQLHVQTGNDLGERMRLAARLALADAAMVLIVGADCPSVDPDYLAAALQKLSSGAQVVLGPAEDGGYVLVGLREPVIADMFEGIDWGSDQVLQQTRVRLAKAGVAWEELSPRWDVDRPEDMARLVQLPDWQ